jgi:uncharacterized membrane protein
MNPGSFPRVASIDLLRGLVMVIMALDHTRDFVHRDAMAFRPEDLAQTTPAIFVTRWITHFCAPVFMFCAGLGGFLRLERGRSTGEMSRFLVTRGLWLIVLEVTVVRIGFFFNVDYSGLVLLLVFWALGLSMIGLAGLIRLPFRVIVVLSVAMIVLHNLFDGVRGASLGAFAWLWRILHEPGLLSIGPPTVVVGYPVVPWVGVMAAGFCVGRVRAINTYGDPNPWSGQRTPIYTALSFFNTQKYPPSLLFLLMTLGPGLVLLGWIDRARPADRRPLLVFGRVPFFYFVVHLPLIHALAIGITWLRYGGAPFLWTPPPTLGTARDVFPPDYGWSLGVTYLVWLVVVALMYPICLWFMRLKQRRRDWWLSYL